MKQTLYSICLILASLSLHAQDLRPAVKNGGPIFAVPEAEKIAEGNLVYKVVTEIAEGVEKRDSLNPTLDKLARLVNLYRHAGVSKENTHIAVMIHFTATPIILSDEAHQKKYGVPNPNTALINEMAENGVHFYVCGQSIYKRKLVQEPRNPNVKVILSAMYGITTLQMQGYTLLP